MDARVASCRFGARRIARHTRSLRTRASAPGWWKTWEGTWKDLKDGPQVQKKKRELLQLIQGTKRGVDGNRKEDILRCATELGELGADSTNTATEVLSAKWKLLWTTEKETLFIFEKFPSAGEAYQVIDVQESTLQNIIEFPPDGAFTVDSVISITSPTRVDFRFEGARIQTKFGSIPLPPFGKGWFENIYVDDTIRLSLDSRGDLLVVERT
eukprot:scaffold1401_cov330-Pavlova_lutheri.AAC.40